jgi:hypothetical protein
MSAPTDLEAQVLDIERMGGKLVSADVTRLPDERDHVALMAGLPSNLAGETLQLRELWRRCGYDPDAPGVESAGVRALIARGKSPIAGGATGLAATAYMSNLPAEGSFIMNSAAFARETERNEMPLETKAIGLGGAPIDLRIPNIGILGGLKLVVKGTLVVSATGTTTSGYGWPWNLLGRVSLNLQGQTGITSCPGMDLRARNRRVYRNPKEDVSTAPAATAATGDPAPGVIAAGSYAVVLVYDIPIVHDAYTLTGAIYAQSDAVYMNWRVQPATSAELFTLAGGAPAPTFTGTIYTTVTFYDIPFSDTQQGRKVLLPDLRWLHSVISADKPFSNVGDVQAEVIRTAGQLVMLGVYLDNGGITQIDPAAWDQLSFGYGGNKMPRLYSPMEILLDKNAQDYSGRIRPGWAILDFEIDNPDREIVYPKGVTELKVTPKVAAGTTVNANARVHQVYEILFAGAG